MNLEQDERRGEQARQLLESPLLKEAFQTIELRLLNELATIEIKPDRAEYLRQLIVMGRKYKGYLEQIMVTGDLAVQQRTLMQNLKDGVKRVTGY